MIRDYNIAEDAAIGIHKIAGGGGFTMFGDIFHVDYRNGSDSMAGTTPKTAVKTLSKAHTLVTSNNNDCIIIDGDSDVVETAMIDFTKNRVHVFADNGPMPIAGYGCGAKVSLGITGVATNIATLKNTGVRNSFNGIKFINSDTVVQGLHCVADGGEYTRWNFSEFYKSSLLTTNLSAEFLDNGDSCSHFRCTFGDLVNQRGGAGVERPNVKFDRETIAGKVCRDGYYEQCRFLHKAAHVDACFMYGHNATDIERSLMIKDSIFFNCVLAAATIADAINFGAAQTDGKVLLVKPAGMNISAIAGANLGVFVASETAQTTHGLSEEIAA